MTTRRTFVRELLASEPQMPEEQPKQTGQVRVPSGAVRAMGLELTKLDEQAREAEQLRHQVESGAVVVELDPHHVEPSFVSDRLGRTEDSDFRQLLESMRASKQQVPILVRPHPDKPGHYQIAYGHRRRDAAIELGVSVRAVVRNLSDQELVIAQGKENAERRDLSFIERARFAANLERRGFDRATANAALGVHAAEMTRLLAVVSAVPSEIIQAIGPAPKAGRPRWMELARLLGAESAARLAQDFVRKPPFLKMSSDRRFDALLGALRATAGSEGPVVFRNAQGDPVVRAERAGKILRLSVDEKMAPGLGAFLLEALPELLAQFGTSTKSSGA